MWNCTQTIENDQRGMIGPILATCFSPDNKNVMVGRMFGGADIYDVSTGTLQHRLKSWNSIALVAISPDNQLCALSTGVLNVELWNIKTGTRLQVIKHDVTDCTLSFSANDNYL